MTKPPDVEPRATTTSIIHVTEPHWLLGESPKQERWTLERDTLTTVGKKTTQVRVTEGKVWHDKALGIQLRTEHGVWLRGTATTRSQWAMWLQAFHALSPPKTAQPSPSRVQFSNQVRVRRIPSVTDEDAPHLYYSSVEMATMSKAMYV